MLVYSLLQKEPSKRPSIWEIANIKCIKEQLNRFVKENNCGEYVDSLINLDQKKKGEKNSFVVIGRKTNSTDNEIPSSFYLSKLRKEIVEKPIEQEKRKDLIFSEEMLSHFNSVVIKLEGQC